MINNNVVLVGDEFYYLEKLKLKYFLNDKDVNLVRINNLTDLRDKSGFLLILTLDDLSSNSQNLIDVNNVNVYEIDRLFRRKFMNFEYVILISIEEFDYGYIHFSNMYVEFANKYFDMDMGISLLVDELYDKYVNKLDTKYSRIRISNINKLKEYIDKQDIKYISTEKIIEDLGVNRKWIQRYMRDMNLVYNNIGYNKKSRLWYMVD